MSWFIHLFHREIIRSQQIPLNYQRLNDAPISILTVTHLQRYSYKCGNKREFRLTIPKLKLCSPTKAPSLLRFSCADGWSVHRTPQGVKELPLHPPHQAHHWAQQREISRWGDHDICHPIRDIYGSDRALIEIIDNYIRMTGINWGCPWHLGYRATLDPGLSLHL